MADILTAMDEQLVDAARSGDVGFLRQALAACEANGGDYSYFLSRFSSPTNDGREGTIFHLAVWHRKVDFFREAIERLPIHVVEQLLSQQEPRTGMRVIPNANPLHAATFMGVVEIVRLILDFYGSSSSPDKCVSSDNLAKPWLARDLHGQTPLHIALQEGMADCAMELLLFDGSVANKVDNFGNSPLFLAVQNGFTHVALQILKSPHPYSLSGSDGVTPLHHVPKCSEEVCRLLLERHSQLLIKERELNDGFTVMHAWVRFAELWPFEYILKSNDIDPELRSAFMELILVTDKYGNNPLHDCVARDGNPGAARMLVDAYKQEGAKQESITSSLENDLVPWLRPNRDGQTPLDLTIFYENNEEVGLCFLTPEINSVLQGHHNPLFRAIEKQRYKIADGIVTLQNEYGWSTGLTSGRGRNVLHQLHAAPTHYKADVWIWLVGKLPHLITEKDDNGKTPLDEASEADATWLMTLMLGANPSALSKSPSTWIEACKRGRLFVINAFIDNCPSFRDLCFQSQTTPLHHIVLEGYTQYQAFLKIPLVFELRNFQDPSGSAPLHQAIRNRNILLTEVLLTTDDVSRSIHDRKGKTPMDLLVEACNESREWNEMCKRLGIVPGLKTTYFQDKTNLLEVRNTLSVVAALLATITFTAGFTLPGGFNSDSGKAVLGDKAAFLVFLIADAIAMCCSMLVLVFLIWSMVCDKNKALVLIDRSIPLLMLALYSTLLAFMTGVYIVMPHKSLWAVIIVLVMCSVIIISSKRSIMFKVLDKLNPVTNRDYKDEIRLLEQGRTSTFQGGSSSEQKSE